MVKILIVTHGPLGEALIETADLILGKTNHTTAFGLYHGDNIELLQKRIEEFVQAQDDGDGILMLTDLLGGSPCNKIALAIKALENTNKVECVVGVNLPILLEAISMQNAMTLKELVQHCKTQGANSILSLREKFEF